MNIFNGGIFILASFLSLFTPLADASAQSGEGGGQSLFTGLLPFVLLFALFYFLIIRPQQKRSRSRENMLKDLKRGDEIITGGGIYATITERDGDTLRLEIAKGVTVKASVSAAASKVEEKAGN